MNDCYDAIIIGGSYAGLSAAMSLGRSMRRVLVIDSGLPCNRQTPHSHNFLTQDGATPAALSGLARAQVALYPTVSFHDGLATGAAKTDDGFEVTTESGKAFAAHKLIFATGIKDLLPGIPGFAECWGISVVHCPYCHGYEARGHKTAIMANGDRAMHLASLVANLTKDLTVLTNGPAAFSPEQIQKLTAHNIAIMETGVAKIKHEAGQVKSIVFNDGAGRDFETAYAAVPFVQHCAIPEALGCELAEGGYIRTDFFQKTTVPGVFACGDNASMMRSVAGAVASGSLTGAMVNKELTDERF